MLLLTETSMSLSLENQQLATQPSCLLQTASSLPSVMFHTYGNNESKNKFTIHHFQTSKTEKTLQK